MFTGIVSASGTVTKARSKGDQLELTVFAPPIARDLRTGDSVAVNGVCLTAKKSKRRRFLVEVMNETLGRTSLSRLAPGASVNLELAAKLSDRIGGHLVQGHVDGTATVVRLERDHGSTRVWLDADPQVLRYVVPKGSITVDGVSLTVVGVEQRCFEVALIPYTLEVTNLRELEVGSVVNVEVDVLAKYVEKLVGGSSGASRTH